ncbi:hypothetical protein FK498_17030, partial [Elioraea sp. Yellowstone]
MRAADRLLIRSDRPRSGAAVLASLALHGGALAAALAGLMGSGAAPGRGEPQAIAVVFVPGAPSPLPESAGDAEAAHAAEAAIEPEAAPSQDVPPSPAVADSATEERIATAPVELPPATPVASEAVAPQRAEATAAEAPDPAPPVEPGPAADAV